MTATDMARTRATVCLILLAVSVNEIESSSEAMKRITSGFLKAVEECKEEKSDRPRSRSIRTKKAIKAMKERIRRNPVDKKILSTEMNMLHLTDNILRDLYNYWKEDYELLNRDTGCAMRCMSKKLDIIDSSGKLHHGNAQEFAMKHGAGNDMASKLVSLIHDCEKQQDGVEDECINTLEVAKCFRTGIHALNWAPKIDVILTEVMTEL